MNLKEALKEIERRDEIINSYKKILHEERQLVMALAEEVDDLRQRLNDE